jgi:CDP-2,3-bis-(O-geranylgeranyl)-sn-glycerol synthase
MENIQLLLFSLWFFLPAGIANMAPILVKELPLIKNFTYPVDGYLTWRKQRLLGDHKTIRGIIVAIISGAAIGLLQYHSLQLQLPFRDVMPESYSQNVGMLFGATLGFGAITGDLVKSFFKRRKGIESGEAWLGLDQLDYIVGGVIASLFFTQLSILVYLYIFSTYTFLHFLMSFIGYKLKLKKTAV